MIGKPSVPPFWSLGWHSEMTTYSETVDDLPLDSILIGPFYADNTTAFSVNKTEFKDIKTWSTTMHSKGLKTVPVIQSGIPAVNATDAYLQDGISKTLFIKSTKF